VLLLSTNNKEKSMAFESGKSGNLKGRPKNTGHRQQLFKTLVEPHKEKLFEVAINLALSGNEPMLRLFLERMLPAKPTQNPVEVTLTQENIAQISYLESYGRDLILAVSNGHISPNDARSLSMLLESHRKLIEQGELTRKLNEIEEAIKVKRVQL
jgi:hypothetical protein